MTGDDQTIHLGFKSIEPSKSEWFSLPPKNGALFKVPGKISEDGWLKLVFFRGKWWNPGIIQTNWTMQQLLETTNRRRGMHQQTGIGKSQTGDSTNKIHTGMNMLINRKWNVYQIKNVGIHRKNVRHILINKNMESTSCQCKQQKIEFNNLQHANTKQKI